MTEDAIDALVDKTIAQAIAGAQHGELSMVGLYRLFLRAYDRDEAKARAGFVQYWRGELPAEVLAHCNRVIG